MVIALWVMSPKTVFWYVHVPLNFKLELLPQHIIYFCFCEKGPYQWALPVPQTGIRANIGRTKAVWNGNRVQWAQNMQYIWSKKSAVMHKDPEAQVMPSRRKSPICAPRPKKERNNHGQSRNRSLCRVLPTHGICRLKSLINVLNTQGYLLWRHWQMTDACIFSLLRPAEFAPF